MKKRTPEQIKQWTANRRLPAPEVIERLPASVLEYATQVGKWVWITFPEKPEPVTIKAIKDLGFKWNNRRSAWQHPCGVFSTKGKGDPRNKYGAIAVLKVRDQDE